MCDCLYFSWSFPPLFSSPIKLYLHSQISLLWFFLFLFPIPLAVTRRSKHFCRCLAAHQVQPTNLLHPENVFICCLSSLRQLPASQTAAENNCRTVLRESGVSPFAAYHPPCIIHCRQGSTSQKKGSMQAVFALQFTSPTTGRQLQYMSGKKTSPKCQAEAFVRKL